MSTISIGSTNVLSVFKGTTAIKSVYRGAVKIRDFFSPLYLFANGEQGVWYEPSTTTAFRSTTDLTPCGYGDACGFLLDKSQGAGYSGGSFTGLGSELITNGDFATNDLTGWTDASSGGTVTVSNEEVTLSRTAGTARLRQTVSVTPGKTYLISFDLVNTNPQNRGGLYVGSTGPATNDLIPGWLPKQGNNSFIVTAPTSLIYFTFYTENIGFDPIFDNISVKEIPGNHATQTTFDRRPILARVPEGGRRNILPASEGFADWDALDCTYSGTTLTSTVTSNARIGLLNYTLPATGTYTFTVEASAGTADFISLNQQQFSATPSNPFVYFDLANGTVGTNADGIPASITEVSAGRYRCSFTFTTGASDVVGNIWIRMSDADGSLAVTNGATVELYNVQLEAGSSATAYQKVVDEYDITEAGVDSLDYLSFDGTGDYLRVSAIDFTATDEMSLFVGMENEVDVAQRGEIISFRPTDGQFTLAVPANSGGADFSLTSQGTILREAGVTNTATYDAPFTGVLTGAMDISTPNVALRVNGAQVAQNTGSQGTGNFGSGAFDIGSSAGSLSFTGKIFGAIARGASSTTDEISYTETYLANLVGFYAPTITGVPTIGVS